MKSQFSDSLPTDWQRKATYWCESKRSRQFNERTDHTDVLRQLRVLSAVCKWRGQHSESKQLSAEHDALKAQGL